MGSSNLLCVDMNAYELADELEEMGWLGTATMLRQQEVEIERIASKHEEMLRQQQAEIEALKAKTLTDEEIGEIYKEFFGFKPKDKYAVDFANAILRKAQEK